MSAPTKPKEQLWFLYILGALSSLQFWYDAWAAAAGKGLRADDTFVAIYLMMLAVPPRLTR